jgi:hypothetical protein
VLSQAESSAPSYADKKQGRVAFESEAEKAEATAAEETSETMAPEAVEPAAGAEDAASEAETNSLADDMKLPRKN